MCPFQTMFVLLIGSMQFSDWRSVSVISKAYKNLNLIWYYHGTTIILEWWSVSAWILMVAIWSIIIIIITIVTLLIVKKKLSGIAAVIVLQFNFLSFGGCDMCGGCSWFVGWGVRGVGPSWRWIFNFWKLPSFFVFIDTLIIIQLASCLIGLGSILMHAIDS